MAYEEIGPFAQRFIDPKNPQDLNHNLAVVRCDPDEDGSPIRFDKLLSLIESRLQYLPRFRRTIRESPLHVAGAILVDDPDFDLHNHVGHVELTGPEGLDEYIGEYFREPLDHARPLWDARLVTGLPGGRSAVIGKAHHFILDGVLGAQSLGILLLDSGAHPDIPTPPNWHPGPEPKKRELFGFALKYHEQRARERIKGSATSLKEHNLKRFDTRVKETGEVVSNHQNHAPSLPFNQGIGNHWRIATVDFPLQPALELTKTHEPTVTFNDIALSILAGGMRAWMLANDLPTTRPHVLVPISLSLRAGVQQGFDERDSFMTIMLPTEVADPLARLEIVRAQTQQERGEPADAISDTLELASVFGRRVVRWSYDHLISDKAVNFVMSDIRGPGTDVFVAGCQVSTVTAFAGIFENQGLRICVLTLSGKVNLGITYDPVLLSRPDVLVAGIEDAAQALMSAHSTEEEPAQ